MNKTIYGVILQSQNTAKKLDIEGKIFYFLDLFEAERMVKYLKYITNEKIEICNYNEIDIKDIIYDCFEEIMYNYKDNKKLTEQFFLQQANNNYEFENSVLQ